MGDNTKNWIIGGLILLSFILALVFWPAMPDKMITHWNALGQPNGWGPKCMGLLLMPFVLLFLYILFWLIPKIDPLRKNIMKFYQYYQNFILLIMGFLFYIYVISILLNLNYQFSMNFVLFPALAVLFYYIGVLLEKAKRNWFIGIRTPWTLSSDRVWKKTHQRGAKLFKVIALLFLLGMTSPLGQYSLWIILGPVLAIAAYLVIYSYFEYRREEKK